MSAIDPKYADQDEFSLLKVLEETSGREMPQAIKDILNANILHDLECDADKMKDTVKNILEVQNVYKMINIFSVLIKIHKMQDFVWNLAFCAFKTKNRIKNKSFRERTCKNTL